jgi:hypothetical protein
VRAMVLRAWIPNSRAAELHDLSANLKDRQARLAAKRVSAPALGFAPTQVRRFGPGSLKQLWNP